ncbi:MAG: Sigma-70 region 2 [Acidobacteriota bacterium]|jgi:RNA polymerase sigma factor (sigma-70 family)|nr:Sigma-70 region 2 [Acidobacteriota bacterium]
MQATATLTLADALRMLAVRRGDSVAWEIVYRDLWPFVLSITRRALPAESAEDAAQDVFLKVARYCPFDELENEVVLKAYLARTAVRSAANLLRQRLVRSETSLAPEHDQPDPAAEFERRVEVVDLFDRIMHRLKPEEAALVTHLLADSRTADVAAEQGVSYGTAAVRLHRLRRRLWSLLRGSG